MSNDLFTWTQAELQLASAKCCCCSCYVGSVFLASRDERNVLTQVHQLLTEVDQLTDERDQRENQVPFPCSLGFKTLTPTP